MRDVEKQIKFLFKDLKKIDSFVFAGVKDNNIFMFFEPDMLVKEMNMLLTENKADLVIYERPSEKPSDMMIIIE